MVPVDCGGAGLLPTQLRVPVLCCVLVVVAELGLRQERTQLLRLLRAHAQVAVVEVLLYVHEEDVPGGQGERGKSGQLGQSFISQCESVNKAISMCKHGGVRAGGLYGA